MLAENYNLKKIAIIVIGGLVIFFFAIWLYGYLTQGRIVVKTDDQENYVRVIGVKTEEDSKQFSEEHQGNFSLRVKPGVYTVSVFGSNGTYGTNKTVTVKARQKVNITLNPSNIINAEPVYGQGVNNLFPGANRLVFIDATTNTLKTIDSSNHVNPLLSSGLRLKNMQWIDGVSGVAQTFDGNLYVVRGQDATRVNLPFNVNDARLVNYSVSPNDKLYVSNGGDIYSRSLDTQEPFKKIYSTGGSASRLFAGPNEELAVIGLGMRWGANSLITIGSDGHAHKKDIDATMAAWSPDGKYLAVGSRGNYVILSDSLRQIKVFSAPSSSAIEWRSNDSFFYNISDQLWQYDVTDGEAKKLSALGASNNITGIFFNPGDPYVYFNDDAGRKSLLLRVGLENRKFSDALISLRAFLPKTVGVCTMNYVNFTKPVITVSFPSSGTLPKNCIKASRAEFKQYDLNPDEFSFVATPRTVKY